MRKSVVVTEQKSVWGVIKGRDTLTATDLASDLDCSPQTANYWLTKFVRLGYLEKVRIGREFGYAVNARGKVLQGDVNTPDTFRPKVAMSCDHLYSAWIPAGDGTGYYECADCEMTWDEESNPSTVIDIPF